MNALHCNKGKLTTSQKKCDILEQSTFNTPHLFDREWKLLAWFQTLKWAAGSVQGWIQDLVKVPGNTERIPITIS